MYGLAPFPDNGMLAIFWLIGIVMAPRQRRGTVAYLLGMGLIGVAYVRETFPGWFISGF